MAVRFVYPPQGVFPEISYGIHTDGADANVGDYTVMGAIQEKGGRNGSNQVQKTVSGY